MPRIDLADYELSERLGTGTVGSIFLAKHKASGDVFAVKFLSPSVSNNALIVSRFHREMLILEKLSHPNILAYYGGGRHDEQLFYVMEYIRGGTLKDLLRRSGPLSWREAAESARQISAALQHAHNHGIIHRDLKPGNVFITETGELKLGDFGIARDTQAADLTEAGLTVGTYSYMAPELVRGERAVTGQVDLYALGCVLFELMTGHPPFQGDNFAQIFDQHLNAQAERIPNLGVECPVQLDELIQQLLAKEPEQRPFNARAVQGELSDLLDPQSNVDVSATTEKRAVEVLAAQQMLSQRVSGQLAGHTSQTPDVSWAKLAICFSLIVAAIVGVAWASR